MACIVEVKNGQLSAEEQQAYIEYAREQYGKEPVSMVCDLDGEYVNLTFNFGKNPFQRIRRITGYLVGTLDRFNNAKRAEEGDRVKHGTM